MLATAAKYTHAKHKVNQLLAIKYFALLVHFSTRCASQDKRNVQLHYRNILRIYRNKTLMYLSNFALDIYIQNFLWEDQSKKVL